MPRPTHQQAAQQAGTGAETPKQKGRENMGQHETNELHAKLHTHLRDPGLQIARRSHALYPSPARKQSGAKRAMPNAF
jgi:hypothetical protein